MQEYLSQDTINAPPEFNAKPKSHTVRRVALTLIGIILLSALVAWYFVGQYNSIETNDELVDAEWSNLLGQYTRRADLAPNLIAIVKAYASNESKLFSEIAAARANSMTLATAAGKGGRDGEALDRFQKAQNELAAPLSRLLLLAENYPDLKASELYRDLMVQLEGTENRITYSRHRYIDAVARYNLSLRHFPSNVIASHYGYQPRAQFRVENESALLQAPKFDAK
jgi:LemA protein